MPAVGIRLNRHDMLLGMPIQRQYMLVVGIRLNRHDMLLAMPIQGNIC